MSDFSLKQTLFTMEYPPREADLRTMSGASRRCDCSCVSSRFEGNWPSFVQNSMGPNEASRITEPSALCERSANQTAKNADQNVREAASRRASTDEPRGESSGEKSEERPTDRIKIEEVHQRDRTPPERIARRGVPALEVPRLDSPDGGRQPLRKDQQRPF